MTCNHLPNMTCMACDPRLQINKAARPDSFPSHAGIGACLQCASFRARIEGLEKVAEYAEHHPNCGYTFDHVTQTGEMIGCTCGLSAALDAARRG